MPLGRAFKVSRAVARRSIEGRPVECGALPITGANFRTAVTRVKACQINITSRVEEFAAMHRTSAYAAPFPPLPRRFSYIIFRAAPIPLKRSMA